MAQFIRVDYQQVYTFKGYQTAANEGAALKLTVGDLISRNAATNEVAKITTMAAAKQAKDDGMELYIVAQGDAVTNKTGTAYKSYKISQDVTVGIAAASATLIAGYRVDNLDNITL